MYDSQDLRGIVSALSTSVHESRIDVTKAKAADFGVIMDNVWQEARRLENRIRGVSNAIGLGLSVTGALAGEVLGGSTGGSIGLLAGLGFKVLDESVEGVSPKVGERLLKILSPGYVGAVFDFRKKYHLTGR